MAPRCFEVSLEIVCKFIRSCNLSLCNIYSKPCSIKETWNSVDIFSNDFRDTRPTRVEWECMIINHFSEQTRRPPIVGRGEPFWLPFASNCIFFEVKGVFNLQTWNNRRAWKLKAFTAASVVWTRDFFDSTRLAFRKEVSKMSWGNGDISKGGRSKRGAVD